MKNYEDQLKRQIERIEKLGLSESNIDLVRRFNRRIENLDLKTRTGYALALRIFFENVPNKPVNEITRDDLNGWLGYWSLRKPGTYNLNLIRIKVFLRFIHNLDDETPGPLKGIKPRKVDQREREMKLAKAILSKEEILRLIAAAPKTKYKAMLAVVFDAALRKSELMDMRIGDIELGDGYADITVRHGKGGVSDVVTIIDSVPYLQAWLNEHPFYRGENTDPDIPLWPREKSATPELTGTWAIEWLLEKLPAKVGIKKRLWPHLTRHSKISNMLAEGYSIVEAKQHARHRSLNSTMVYSHLAENGLKEKMLAKAGKLPEKAKAGNPMAPITCGRCKEANLPTAKFCLRCGLELGKDPEAIKKEILEMVETKKKLDNLDDLVKKRADEIFAEMLKKAGGKVKP